VKPGMEQTTMILQRCRECGREVSHDAVLCPECGAPRPTREEWTGTGIDWKSRTKICGIPLIHVAFGRNNKGKRRVAKGFIAIGQFAVGAVTIAQFGIGIVFGVGQFMLGLTAFGQLAFGLIIAVGQIAAGTVTIGQLVTGIYGLAQAGWVKYMWSYARVDMEAVALYCTIQLRIEQWLGF